MFHHRQSVDGYRTARVVRVEEISPSTFDVGLVLDMDAFSANVFLQAVRDNHVQLEMAPKS